ncbi:MAG TPA: hypothetical protein VMX74_04155 [Pirellulales bacterium]|nr:hypothetical protein [Pirellulales bacterium]
MRNGDSLDEVRPSAFDLRRDVPAWIISLLLHTTLIIVLSVSIQLTPPGVAEETDRTTGIVLKHVTDSGEYYEGEDIDIEAASESLSNQATDAALQAALPNPSDSKLDVGALLPSQHDGPGLPAGALPEGGTPDLSGPAPGTNVIRGGKARTSVFGLTGEGYKFAYVFDASSSMTSDAGRPLAAAKRELISSLQSLGKTHQFQIIFYNEYQTIFNPTGVQGRLFFATEPNVEAAEKFVAGVRASLSTDHYPALITAINMSPDVIFFLTDGEDPSLTGNELTKIAERNRGSAIHVIQFGTSPPSRENWLKKLARQNAGQYQFFNVRRLSEQKK